LSNKKQFLKRKTRKVSVIKTFERSLFEILMVLVVSHPGFKVKHFFLQKNKNKKTISNLFY